MMTQTDLATMYANRRERLMSQIGTGVALIGCSAGAPDPFLFDKNLAYLTGRKEKDVYLLLAAEGVVIDRWETQTGPEVGRGRKVKTILFVRELTPREKAIDGEGAGNDEVKRATGVDAVLDVTKLDEVLGMALMEAETLWVNVGTRPSLDKALTPDIVLLNKVRERFVWIRMENIAPLIHEMRRIKEPYEVDCLREAFRIHSEIYEKIMASLKPGDNESKGKAIWDYETGMRSKDVSGFGLDRYNANIIVAAGKNAAYGHYMDNNQEIKDGDLVLIDTGVDYKGYCSDITRTFPANGKFTDRQKELYGIVLEAQKAAIATMKPGSTTRAAHEAVYEVYKKHGVEKWGYGTCGHGVGLNIHDANGFRDDDDKPFVPGVVLVIEPCLFMPEEGIGIRIEDGVLIAENGCELLPGPPKEIEAVERLCSEKK